MTNLTRSEYAYIFEELEVSKFKVYDKIFFFSTSIKIYILISILGKVYLWAGKHAIPHKKEMGEAAGKRLASALPAEMGLGESATFITVNSGGEAQDLLSAFGGRREQINKLFGK